MNEDRLKRARKQKRGGDEDDQNDDNKTVKRCLGRRGITRGEWGRMAKDCDS